MSQSDLNIANVTRTVFRQEVNEALQALGSLSSGATEPSTTYAYQLWADTGSGLLKQRTAANDGWINKGNLADVDWGFLNKAGGSMSGLLQLDQSTNIVAAANTNLVNASGNAVTVTHASGTVVINSFGGAGIQSGTEITITWSVSGGSLSVKHSATHLIIPGGADLPIADGDVWKVQKISDSQAYWRVIDVTKADGTPVVPVIFASSAENAAGIIEGKAVDPLGIREAFNATGSAPVYACRAWVNFNGTGTVAIRASGNVSSITDNGQGDYTINFTTAMPDANYAAFFGGQSVAANNFWRLGSFGAASTNGFSAASIRLNTFNAALAFADTEYATVAIFR